MTFNANGGEGTMDPQVITADEPTALNANAFTREGYNFLYWSDSANGSKLFGDGDTIIGEDDLALYAIWQKDHYTLTFHSNFDPDQTTTQDVPLNADSITLNPNTFEREGYKFLGWAFMPNDASPALTDGATLGFDDDTDLYAVWAKNTYTVLFDANGGEGTMEPQNIVKDVSTPLSLNQFTREGYDFIGWSTEPNGQIWFEDGASINTDADDDFTLYAQWQVKEYTITFKNDDGTVLQTYTIEHGQTPAYTNPTEPAKDGDAQYTYTWSGWTPAIVPATADATYTAKYVRTLNQYDVTFVDEDGTELAKYTLDYGTLPVYDGETPTKADTAQYDYEFAGWSPTVKNVDGDQTYTATYSETLRSYTVTWVNEDGTELKVDTVDYGVVPTYTGATPTKAATAQYTYTFDGWTEEPVAVTGDVTYTAKFAATVNEYTIKFVDFDGTELQSGSVAYGEMPTAPAAPSKAADAQYTYTFAGWTPEISAVTGDQTYTATYTSEVNKYTVTWLNWDGTLLLAEDYDYGTTPAYNGGEPTKAADAQYTYTFSGWDKELTPVTGAVTYTAVFTSTVNTYTITWLAEDGTVLETDTEVPYGTTPTFDGETPTKAETDTTVYAFGGWTPEVASVTSDASYTAVFTSSDRLYDVQWLAEDGSVLETQSGVKFDDELTYPGTAEPTKEGDQQYSYTFSGWTRTVDGDTITMRAGFEQSVNTYTVTWIVEGNAVETDHDVPYGTVPSYDGETPVKEATAQYTYTFAGWDKALDPITGDTVFTATFTSEENTYQLTFNANGADGDMTAQTLVYGVETAIKANTFTWDGHYFLGWNTAADGSGTAYAKDGTIAITADTELFAQWAPDGWVRDANGLQYYVEGEALRSGWTKLDDGNWYYFYPETGYAATGYAMVPYAPAETGNTYGPYEVDLKPEAGHPEYAAAYAENGEFVFDENGVFQLNQTGKVVKDGTEWWCQNGEILWHARLVTDGTNYYYGTAGGELKRSVVSGIGDTNGLLPAGVYTFADDGHIIMYNGIIEQDGGKWYYENGRRTYKGLFQPDGSDYYYAASDGRIICGQDYYVTKTNDLFPAGVYTFDDEGRMVLNGLYEQGGELWYYENGVKTPKGLVKIGDDYYYIKPNGAAVRGADYYVTKTNGLKDVGMYTFGDDGKMVIDDTVKNGLIWEDGKLWYYVEGVRTHKGLIYEGGYYYYIKSNGQAVTDARYFVSNTNDLMPAAYHNFDAEGHMTDVPTVKNGLVEENGRLWYYENGEKAHPGLIQVDGDYYYICTTGYAVAGCDYFISNTNGLQPVGTYTFADDGKMILPDPTEKNGIIEEDGQLYYYVDGVRTHAGLVEWEGNLYYIKSNCTAVRDCDYFVSNTNGLMSCSWHHFNADGTMEP